MSNYTKEKNIIIINLDGASAPYRFDINTAILYGVRGSAIKTCPNKSAVRNLFPWTARAGANNVAYVMYRMIDHCASTAQYSRYINALKAADKLDALNIPCLELSRDNYEYVGDHIKQLQTYLQNNEVADFRFGNFHEWVEFESIRHTLGDAGAQLTAEWYMNLKGRLPDITKQELSVCAYYLNRGKLAEYEGNYNACYHLVEYLNWCRAMNIEPQKVNNFMREYCETYRVYKLRKIEFDNKRIAENYAQHSAAWEFEFGDFAVSIPTCGQDLVTEGLRMHHCVGSYVDKIVTGACYICFIRRKDAPDDCYITCEVRPSGRINQYFLAYDRYISNDEDLAFRSAFQEHLNNVWNNQ